MTKHFGTNQFFYFLNFSSVEVYDKHIITCHFSFHTLYQSSFIYHPLSLSALGLISWPRVWYEYGINTTDLDYTYNTPLTNNVYHKYKCVYLELGSLEIMSMRPYFACTESIHCSISLRSDIICQTGTTIRVLDSSAVYCGFEPLSGQTKGNTVDMCWFYTNHAALTRPTKDWLSHIQYNVSK